jgi:hypothetical protein
MGRPRLTDEERKARIAAKNKKYYEENKAKWDEYTERNKPDPLALAKRSIKRLTEEEKALILAELNTL